MYVERLERFRDRLLRGEVLTRRGMLIFSGVCTVAFLIAAVVGGYTLVAHAMDENRMLSRHPVDTPSQISLLFAGHDPADLVNYRVYLNRVTLTPAPAGNAYYATDEKGDRLLVVAHDPKRPSDDAVASVTGTVRPLNYTLLKELKISKAERKTLKAQGVYLDAAAVKIRSNTSTIAHK
jgi:hypothetical protein